ncbi:MAG: metallopeptidase TldD-related protein [Planctomycetota bacterium JB042]
MSSFFLALLLLASVEADATAAPADDPVLLRALERELVRSFEGLANVESDPLYFLAYRATESRSLTVAGAYGALHRSDRSHDRRLDVAARIGSPELDSTHQIRGEFEFGPSPATATLPLEDDEEAIAAAAWSATDRAFKEALQRFLKVKTNEAVKVEAEDASPDFSIEPPSDYREPMVDLVADEERWQERVRRLSAVFREYPFLHESSISLQAEAENRVYASSEGTRLIFGRTHFRLSIEASTKADDGMDLQLFDSFEGPSEETMPDDARIEAAVHDLAARLGRLKDAPVVEPYAGPAIIMNRACGVFFHEIFGHRIEGHRQKNVDEGQTFTKKVGTEIMPPFLSITDDPTRRRFGATYLNGHYKYDDEGVPAQAVPLVRDGVLENFLMARSPIEGFPDSNGHGRCSAGNAPVSRQGNLFVDASDRVSFERLREMLVEEVRAQGKPYGMIFHDISGGFTTTQRRGPQAFKVIPLYVVRVYADGRDDEVVRGVDLVGTPLASITKMIAAADDDAVFNGSCGAESGWVPVSAVAPSVLVKEIEIEKKAKSQERPPLLPTPLHDETDGAPSDDGADGQEDAQ